jgi:hypothetical protein
MEIVQRLRRPELGPMLVSTAGNCVIVHSHSVSFVRQRAGRDYRFRNALVASEGV